MEWLKDRKRAADYLDLLLAKAKLLEVRLFMSWINLGEVYYSTAREWGAGRADMVLTRVRELPINLLSVTDEAVLRAARLKAVHKLSYADSFAAALAIELRCPLLTGDVDFLPLEKAGILQVESIGA
jgi:ribonuclease VapC